MAILTGGIIATAPVARMLAGNLNSGDQPIQQVVATALNSAINSGTFSTTSSMSGYSAQNIQNVMLAMEGLGFTVSLSGTTLTYSW